MSEVITAGLDYTVGDLPSSDYCVSPEVPGKEVWSLIQDQADLPGVIIANGDHLLGMISRRRFLERMSRPYSLEIYLKRPIQALLEIENVPVLEVPSGCSITDAAKAALERPLELVYEPLVVITPGEMPRMVDLHVLLLAQSQILAASMDMVQQQTTALQDSLTQLTEEQRKVQEYAQMLEGQQAEIQRRNQLLENQKAELTQKSQEIGRLNDRFVMIGQLLSLEGKRAFQATFAGVNTIFSTTGEIIQVGETLERELESVDSATRLIEEVSRQVRHLSMQASVAISKAGTQLAGFSDIALEINKLASQTSEASSQVNRVASRFRACIKENNEAARTGAEVARSLIQKIQSAEVALAELQKLVGRGGPGEEGTGVDHEQPVALEA